MDIFGQTGTDETVHRITLHGGGLTANVMTWGAVIQDLRLEEYDHPLVLGFDRFDHYPAHSPYFGAIAGRFANRISNASFDIDGKTYRTDPNFLGKHTLHGGAGGIGKRVWAISDATDSSVTLTLNDPDGAMGFPGNVTHTCRYSLEEGGALRVDLSSKTDAATPVSLAQHSYFALDDGRDCRTTELTINASSYLPVDNELIPTGEIRSVAATPFDFRQAKPIGRDLNDDLIYDHNFCVSEARRPLQDIALAHSPRSGIRLAVSSTEPGLQLYAGHKIKTPVPGLSGSAYGPYAGFALETQVWPDAPNRSRFPNAILRPSETLEQTTIYRFRRD